MAAKKITDYLPKKQKKMDLVLIQAKIDKKLHEKVFKKMKSEGVNWHDLLVASLNLYVDTK